tara:strand:- start:6477 stop:6749 length:273 start_codon:yes stop_codon:yes gene_type:complete
MSKLRKFNEFINEGQNWDNYNSIANDFAFYVIELLELKLDDKERLELKKILDLRKEIKLVVDRGDDVQEAEQSLQSLTDKVKEFYDKIIK